MTDLRSRWWQWPTMLSLDAPAVAVLWQWQLARSAGVAVRPAQAAVLGASVWLAYAADRWIEGWRLDPARVLTERHRFYQRRRWPMAGLWAAVLAADVAVALVRLSRHEFEAGLLLLGPVLAYLLSHQLIHARHRWRAPKELCVAALFGAGVALFPFASPSARLRPAAGPLALFTLLCFANCALISVWENAVDRSHGQVSFAGQFRHGAAFSRLLPWALAGGGAAFSLWAGGAARSAALAATASGLLLGAVDRLQPRLGRQLARVLADVALLTPAVPFLVSHWRP